MLKIAASGNGPRLKGFGDIRAMASHIIRTASHQLRVERQWSHPGATSRAGSDLQGPAGTTAGWPPAPAQSPAWAAPGWLPAPYWLPPQRPWIWERTPRATASRPPALDFACESPPTCKGHQSLHRIRKEDPCSRLIPVNLPDWKAWDSIFIQPPESGFACEMSACS
jgi:hypothetical protein